MVRQRRYRQALHRPHGLTLTTTLALSAHIELLPPPACAGGGIVLGAMRSGRSVRSGEALSKANDHRKAS
jgi:hypothetical protein